MGSIDYLSLLQESDKKAPEANCKNLVKDFTQFSQSPDCAYSDEKDGHQSPAVEVVGNDSKQRGAPVDHPDSEPFDREAWEERATICEFDGGLSREEAEALAWHEDDLRRCKHCLNLSSSGVCKVAKPGGVVSAVKGYRPVDLPQRCAGYLPCPEDPDQSTGLARWQWRDESRGCK